MWVADRAVATQTLPKFMPVPRSSADETAKPAPCPVTGISEDPNTINA